MGEIMTWAEFKQEVERQGIQDTDELLYIDTYPHGGFECRRHRTDDGLEVVEIWS